MKLPEKEKSKGEILMAPRIDYTKVGSGALRAMYGLEKYLAESSVEKPLRELIKLRASQVNGCAYCIDMHWKDARAAGVDRRVDLDRRASCLGRAVRTDTPAVQRTGTRRSH